MPKFDKIFLILSKQAQIFRQNLGREEALRCGRVQIGEEGCGNLETWAFMNGLS
jgi:hypothetical protein